MYRPDPLATLFINKLACDSSTCFHLFGKKNPPLLLEDPLVLEWVEFLIPFNCFFFLFVRYFILFNVANFFFTRTLIMNYPIWKNNVIMITSLHASIRTLILAYHMCICRPTFWTFLHIIKHWCRYFFSTCCCVSSSLLSPSFYSCSCSCSFSFLAGATGDEKIYTSAKYNPNGRGRTS